MTFMKHPKTQQNKCAHFILSIRRSPQKIICSNYLLCKSCTWFTKVLKAMFYMFYMSELDPFNVVKVDTCLKKRDRVFSKAKLVESLHISFFTSHVSVNLSFSTQASLSPLLKSINNRWMDGCRMNKKRLFLIHLIDVSVILSMPKVKMHCIFFTTCKIISQDSFLFVPFCKSSWSQLSQVDYLIKP
jgi:hypothetical protein